MDTEKLFITRKRKKWKFAHFKEWDNCFEKMDVSPMFWQNYFKERPLVLEIGAGTANLSIELAKKYKERNFVAIDVKADRLYAGAKLALQQNINNITFLRADSNELANLFKKQSVQEVWITFPDPFLRQRQAKHRLTHPHFLQLYGTILKTNGTIRFKTDNRALFLWSLEQIVAEKWHIQELSFDLHNSTLAADYKITTTFERRFLEQNIPINYVSFSQ